MSTRSVTLYTVKRGLDPEYTTTDYDKAQRVVELETAGIPAAECVDCLAVIPVALVDLLRGHTLEVLGVEIANACPAPTSRHSTGHRVHHDDYERVR